MKRNVAALLACVVVALAATACRPPNNPEFAPAVAAPSSTTIVTP